MAPNAAFDKMRFPCTISNRGGQWTARHESSEWGVVAAQASSRQEAIEKLRGELRYRLEICPCTGESYQHIDVEIVEQSKTSRRDPLHDDA